MENKYIVYVDKNKHIKILQTIKINKYNKLSICMLLQCHTQLHEQEHIMRRIILKCKISLILL